MWLNLTVKGSVEAAGNQCGCSLKETMMSKVMIYQRPRKTIQDVGGFEVEATNLDAGDPEQPRKGPGKPYFVGM